MERSECVCLMYVMYVLPVVARIDYVDFFSLWHWQLFTLIRLVNNFIILMYKPDIKLYSYMYELVYRR